MTIDIHLTEEMKEKGLPGTVFLDAKTKEVVAYDPSTRVALEEAKGKGYSAGDLAGMWIPDPDKTYIFDAA